MDSLVNHWLCSRAAMMATRSLQNKKKSSSAQLTTDTNVVSHHQDVPVLQVDEVLQVQLSGVLREVDGVHILSQVDTAMGEMVRSGTTQS